VRYPKLRELKEAIKALIIGPYTTKFPHRPHKPFPKFRGAPKYYEDKCVGCLACAEVCPAKVIDVIDDVKTKIRKLVLHYDICQFCGNCQAHCIADKEGIQLTNEFELSTFDRSTATTSIEKELVVCPHCNSPVTAKEHILWIYKKLGPLAYSSPQFMIPALKELELADQHPAQDRPVESRADHINVMCPKCRRILKLKEAYG